MASRLGVEDLQAFAEPYVRRMMSNGHNRDRKDRLDAFHSRLDSAKKNPKPDTFLCQYRSTPKSKTDDGGLVCPFRMDHPTEHTRLCIESRTGGDLRPNTMTVTDVWLHSNPIEPFPQ